MKMLRSLPLTVVAALFASPLLMAVPTEIARESFEGAGGAIGFTTSVPQFDEPTVATSDFFSVILNNGTKLSGGILAGGDGASMFAAEDIDVVPSPGVGPTQFITFNPVNISGKTLTSVKVLLAAPGTGPAGGGSQNFYDHSATAADIDFIRVEASVDGSPFNPILQFSPTNPAPALNSPLSRDTDFDGLGGQGTTLTAAFQEFDVPFPTGNSVQVRIVMHSNATSEYICVDNVRIFGDSPATNPPALAGVPGTTLIFTEGGPAAALAPAITVTDTDSANLASATVTISAGLTSGEDVLAASPSGAILAGDIVYTPGTGTLTITRSAPLATYQTVLRSVTYQNTNVVAPSTATRNITFHASDGTNGSNSPVRQVQVVDNIAVQNLPFTETFETDGRGTRYALDGRFTNGAAMFDRGQPSGTTNLDGTFAIIAEDTLLDAAPVKAVGFLLNTAAFATVNASVRLGALGGAIYDTGDIIAIEASVNGGAFTTIAAFRSTGGASTPMALDTDNNGTGDGTQLSATMQDFSFPMPAATTLGLRVRCQSNTAGERLIVDRIVVTGVPSAPPTVSNVNVNTNEEAVLTFTAANFTGSYSDPNGDPLSHVQVTSLPTNGVLRQGAAVISLPFEIAIGNIGMLNYTPNANYSGPDSFGWNGKDGNAYAAVAATVNITVHPINDEPTLDAIGNPVAILEDAAQQTINLAGIGAGGGETQTLTVMAVSTNPGLIPNPTVNYTSPAPIGSLNYTPVANQFGSAIITVTVMDNGATGGGNDNNVSRTFTVNVTSVNDAPTLNAIANPATIPPDSAQQTVSLSGIGAGGGETQTLTITATSGNPGLIPNPNVSYTSPAPIGSLSYTPVAGQSGSALITVTVMDTGGTASTGVDSFQRTFTVNVGAPNVSPMITGQNAVTTPQETARTIVFGDLLVTDPDNTYPTGFTLTVMDGTNYTRVGNEITPSVGFTGPLSVPVKVNDGNSDSNTFSLAVTVTPPSTDPTATLLYAKGDAVPGAGSPGGVPAGSVFASFGVPAINDNDTTTIAFLGKSKSDAGSGAAIFAGSVSAMASVAKLGDEAPDATGAPMTGVLFKTFKDPVLARDGSVAFLAKLEGATVTKGNDYAIFTNTGGTLKLVAREGATLPGTPALSEVKQFASASLSSDGGDAWVIFTASLVVGPSGTPGPGGVTKADDTGAWRWNGSTGVTTNILREGGVLSGVSTSAVKSFRLLKSSGGSPGQSRGQYAGPNATFQVVFLDKTQALVDSDEAGGTKVFATGEATVPGVAAATWKSFGAPAVPAVAGTGLAFLSQLNKDLGGVTSADTKRLFFSPAAGVGTMVKTSDAAPGLGGTALFSVFKDPVLAPGGNLFAFLGVAKGAGVTIGTDGGIWRGAASGVITLAAQEGTAPPDLDPAARFKSFSSVAASDKGPVFVAKLITGVGGITKDSDIGLWGATTGGTIRKLLAEGDTLDTKTVKVFTVLKAASGSQGVRRSFAAHGTMVVRVNFTDGSSALYEIDVP